MWGSQSWLQPAFSRLFPLANAVAPGDASARAQPQGGALAYVAPEQRDEPGGFTGDPDVMDTWATSSLTPQIAGHPADEDDLMARIFPMDLRPQAHEIIRTWLFYAVLRAHLERGVLPWRHAAISGWILDPDRKKMYKSVGNVVTPMDPLRKHGSDAVRYWAASGRLGADMTFDPGQLRVGRRLAIKILNVSRFVLTLPAPEPGPELPAAAVTEPLDRAMLSRRGGVVATCTEAFDGYDHARALETCEEFFWFFCDDYVELVKSRGYGEQGSQAARSAVTALRLALRTVRSSERTIHELTDEPTSVARCSMLSLRSSFSRSAMRAE